jgi:hypothetical protein
MLSIEGARDKSRQLIALSRSGGVSLRDRPSPVPDGKKMGKSQSSPTLKGSKSGSLAVAVSGTRRSSGWARSEAALPAKFRQLLEEMTEYKVTLDYCEKPFLRTALWEASWKNHEDVVRVLAAKGANIAAADYQGRTPLHEAAYHGHLSLVEFLVDRGHPVDCVDKFGQTPLFRASEAGRTDVVSWLVQRGANPNLLDADRLTAQHVAGFRGLSSMADYLLFNGAYRNRFSLDDDSGSRRSRVKLCSDLLL